MLVVWLLVAASCTCVSTPCEAQGGRCTRTDVECGAAYKFAGYDPACEPNSKCCLPLASPGDAGSCAEQQGTCFDVGHVCASETRYVQNVCGESGRVCCVPYAVACMKKNGHCITQDLPCPSGESRVGGEDLCSMGNQCCGR